MSVDDKKMVVGFLRKSEEFSILLLKEGTDTVSHKRTPDLLRPTHDGEPVVPDTVYTPVTVGGRHESLVPGIIDNLLPSTSDTPT